MPKNIKQIREEFYDYIKSPGSKGEMFAIFINPDPDEIQEAAASNSYEETVRLLVKTDPSPREGDVYAWSADQATHGDVADHLEEGMGPIDDAIGLFKFDVLPLTFKYTTGTLYFSDAVSEDVPVDAINKTVEKLRENKNLQRALQSFEFDHKRIAAGFDNR